MPFVCVRIGWCGVQFDESVQGLLGREIDVLGIVMEFAISVGS